MFFFYLKIIKVMETVCNLLNNLHPFKKGGGRFLSRLLQRIFDQSEGSKIRNYVQRSCACEFTVYIYRGDDSLVDTIGGGGDC